MRRLPPLRLHLNLRRRRDAWNLAVYYNEHDDYTARWLTALIHAGELPDGEVDRRSIVDVAGADLRGFTHCHFFAGIGGWPYALGLAGWPSTRQAWTGSCPCQPFSASGQGVGTDDPRDLWPAWFELITECRPVVCFAEQVASADGLGWFDRVSADMEGQNYAVAAADLCAASVGAPINRPRLFIVAQSLGAGLEGHGGDEHDGHEPGRDHEEPHRPAAPTGVAGDDPARVDALSVLRRLSLHDPRRARKRLLLPSDRAVEERSVWSRFEQVACADGWRQSEPGTFPLAHGIPARVGRLRGYGNAIVPQVAAAFVKAFMELEQERCTPTPWTR